MNENDLKQNFREALSSDFFMQEETPGVSMIDNDSVCIDFLLYPKNNLIEAGFPRVYFGVEVKYIPEPINDHFGRVARLFWQAITYQQSKFTIKGQHIRPEFVLVYSNIEHYENYEAPEFMRAFMQIANLAMVGRFKVTDRMNWNIAFVSHIFFYKKNGAYLRTKSGVGFGHYTGNSHNKRFAPDQKPQRRLVAA